MIYSHMESEYFEAAWRNGIASDYESGDCRFDPCGGHCIFFLFSFFGPDPLTNIYFASRQQTGARPYGGQDAEKAFLLFIGQFSFFLFPPQVLLQDALDSNPSFP